MTVVVSSISDRSSGVSSGYQASIETSSDSVLIFKSDTYANLEVVQCEYFLVVAYPEYDRRCTDGSLRGVGVA